MKVTFGLLQEEGLCLGMSSGINVAGAMKLAKELGPGHNIVTVLCDLGTRYTGKLFNYPYLKEKGLPTPEWLADDKVSDSVSAALERAKVPEAEAAAEQAASVAAAAKP